MITVLGPVGEPEYAAATTLREQIARGWPEVVDDPDNKIFLIAGAKCPGQRKKDIDILLLAIFPQGFKYIPYLPFRSGNQPPQLPSEVEVRTLCAAIEVKDHPPEAVRFQGTTTEVLYREGYSNATEQNYQQVHSVAGYFRFHGIEPPMVAPLLWLRNVPNTSLPPRPHNILGASVTWDMLVNVIAQMTPPQNMGKKGWMLGRIADPDSLLRGAKLFTKEIKPTRLDRARMDRVATENTRLGPLRDNVGERLLILRGRGGTGKTMRLLQLASELYEQEGSRVLILTYNRALVADIRRLLTLLGIRDDPTEKAIQVQTVHSFLYSALKGIGLLEQAETDFLEDYERLKDQALAYLQTIDESAPPNDLARVHTQAFDWDYVFVDEGQDWPKNERDLLLRLYPPAQVVVADGVDQLVRGFTAAEWRVGLSKDQVITQYLEQSLRMKSGLARFVTAMAHHLGIQSVRWEPNEEAVGGKVIIVDGPYLNDRRLHERLLSDNTADQNAPVDMLFCVSPNLVVRPQDGGPSHSIAARVFEEWGYCTWDGASQDVRDSFPTEIEQLRVVQYESCRGLEGWITVNLSLDRFYESKLESFRALEAQAAGAEPDYLAGDEAWAQRHAARWLLIPLTRAMDTLVIQLDRPQSPVRSALEAATRECSDYVEWVSGV